MSLQRPQPLFSDASANRRLLLLLCAFLLILAQAFLAVHAVEHLAGGEVENCQVCLLGGGLDQGAAISSGPEPAARPVPVEIPAQVRFHDATLPFYFRQRAPPYSPSI